MAVRDLIGGCVFAVRNPLVFRKHLMTRSSPRRWLCYTLARIGSPVTENERILRSLRDRHRGQRCFVIGTGPSLRLEDLEKLKGEVTISSNRIYVAFPEVSWRPTYYTCMDTIYAEQNVAELNALDLTKLFPDYLDSYLADVRPSQRRVSAVYFRALPGRFGLDGSYRGNFSPDALRGFHTGPTVTIVNLQLAYYLGCNPIYLLGVDGGYKVSERTVDHPMHGTVVVSEGEQNHFHPAYRARGETYVAPLPEQTETGYRFCREFLEARGVAVFNASRHTCIEAFERIDVDRVLG